MTAITTIDPMERLERIFDGRPFPDPDRSDHVADLAARRSASKPRAALRHKLLDGVEAESKLTGEFTARISDFEIDREGERFHRRAFDNALRKIRKSGRPVPVLFGHRQDDLHSVLGMVPADGFWTDEEGLHARGWLDVTTEPGLKLHEMLRRDVLSWSIGFSLRSSRLDRDGKTRLLTEVGELFELSAVAVPANPRTRTAQLKHHTIPTVEELRERARALGLEDLEDPEVTRHRSEISSRMYDLLRMPIESKSLPSKPKRAKRHAPIQIKSYEVD
jgi:HK97 family phage prohead protease